MGGILRFRALFRSEPAATMAAGDLRPTTSRQARTPSRLALLQPFSQKRNGQGTLARQGVGVERIEHGHEGAHVPGQTGQHVGHKFLIDPGAPGPGVGQQGCSLVRLSDGMQGKYQAPRQPGAYIITQAQLRRRKVRRSYQEGADMLADRVLQNEEGRLLGAVQAVYVVDHVQSLGRGKARHGRLRTALFGLHNGRLHRGQQVAAAAAGGSPEVDERWSVPAKRITQRGNGGAVDPGNEIIQARGRRPQQVKSELARAHVRL